jgi:hypothetical protein
VDRRTAKRNLTPSLKESVENTGTLLASGFIAGEALTGVVLAGLVLAVQNFESMTKIFFGKTEFDFVSGPVGAWMSLAVFGVIAYALIAIPLRKARS